MIDVLEFLEDSARVRPFGDIVTVWVSLAFENIFFQELTLNTSGSLGREYVCSSAYGIVWYTINKHGDTEVDAMLISRLIDLIISQLTLTVTSSSHIICLPLIAFPSAICLLRLPANPMSARAWVLPTQAIILFQWEQFATMTFLICLSQKPTVKIITTYDKY